MLPERRSFRSAKQWSLTPLQRNDNGVFVENVEDGRPTGLSLARRRRHETKTRATKSKDESVSVIVAPSLLSCDFSAIGDDVRRVEAAGADWLHVDVMDGHFVPNLTIGPLVVSAIKRVATKPLDVHLMIENPSKFIHAFAQAGAETITIHVEAEETDDMVADLIDRVRSAGCRVGLSLRPQTPIETIFPYLDRIDMALVMTVNPGFGGQDLIPETVPKIRAVRRQASRLGLKSFQVQVDGGINASTVREVIEAGSDVIVAGSYIFGAPDRDYASRIRHIREAAGTHAE